MCEVEVQRNIGSEDVPIIEEYDRLKYEKRQHRKHAPAVVNEPANVPVHPCQVAIRVPCGEADVDEIELGCSLCAAAALS